MTDQPPTVMSSALEAFTEAGPSQAADLESTDIDRIDEIPSLGSSPMKGSGSSRTSDPVSDDIWPDDPSGIHRARVFALADDGNWEDLATGVFVIENDFVPAIGLGASLSLL